MIYDIKDYNGHTFMIVKGRPLNQLIIQNLIRPLIEGVKQDDLDEMYCTIADELSDAGYHLMDHRFVFMNNLEN